MKSRPLSKKDKIVSVYVYNSAGVLSARRAASGVASNGGSDGGSVARKPTEEGVKAPLTIPHGPKDLETGRVYIVGADKTQLALRALMVESNNDEWLRQTATNVTKDMTASGSHVWDGTWYYWRLPENRHLLLAWGTSKTLGWVLVQKERGSWWYKTNDGQWKIIKNGKSADVYWMVEGSKVSITIEAPSGNWTGWTASDIKYKFGQ